jgi:hypothetical protein
MNPDTLFKKYKKQFIRQLGKGALDNFQLDALGNQLLGNKYLGTFAQDKLPMRSGYLIVNVDKSKRINTPEAHWIAIYQTPKTLYVYDSYGRLTKNVLKLISKTNKKIVDSKHDPEQYGSTAICGQLAMSFLCVAHDLGIRKAITI